MACSSEQNKLQSEITSLEETLDAENSTENAEALINKYMAYLDQFPDDAEHNAKYLYRAAGVQYRMNRFSSAEQYLKQALKDYYPADQTPTNAHLLGVIYDEKLRNPQNAQTVFQALRQAFPNYEKADEVKQKLADDLADLNTRISTLGQQMFNDSLGRIEYRIANDYINSSELYAMMLPEDPKSPEMLHKAGETARSIRSFQKALEYYEWIETKYPNYEKAPQAMFLRAFTLDNDLKQFDQARALYEGFLQKLP